MEKRLGSPEPLVKDGQLTDRGKAAHTLVWLNHILTPHPQRSLDPELKRIYHSRKIRLHNILRLPRNHRVKQAAIQAIERELTTAGYPCYWRNIDAGPAPQRDENSVEGTPIYEMKNHKKK